MFEPFDKGKFRGTVPLDRNTVKTLASTKYAPEAQNIEFYFKKYQIYSSI